MAVVQQPLQLPSAPSSVVKRAAKSAANSKHGIINLTRLVRALNGGAGAGSWLELTRAWETVIYAEALSNEISQANEGELNALKRDIDSSKTRLQALAQATLRPTPSFPPPPAAPLVASADSAPTVYASELPRAASIAPPDRNVEGEARAVDDAPARGIRKRRAARSTVPADYLAQIAREDAQGGEIGLLPVRPRTAQPVPEPVASGRDQLLGGVTTRLGSAQLHEELGGQLVGMSQRLKQNAMHFANSLEEEKALLQNSQDTLQSTQQSKGNLSRVSKKSRGTTCMTIGVVVLVLVLFIWTYLLIRFT